MGQYYRALLIQEGNTSVHISYDYGAGAKLMEHSWIRSPFVNNVWRVLRNRPTQVAWMGDYADGVYKELLTRNPLMMLTGEQQYLDYYKLAWPSSGGPEVDHVPEEEREPLFDLLIGRKGKHYLLNHTKECYLDVGKYYKKNVLDGWCVNPLPLLTACGNGQGGGDYFHSTGESDIGTWAFDVLEYCYKKPPLEYGEEVFFFSARD